MAFPETIFKWLNNLRNEAGKTTVIYPTAFLVAVSISLYMLGMVFYLRDQFGVSAKVVGAFQAVWWLSYLIFCIVLQPVYNRILPRVLVLMSTALSCIVILGLLTAAQLWMVFIYQVLFGAAISLCWPPLMGWLSHGFEGRELSRIQGKYNLCWCTGGIAGPFLAGLLSNESSVLTIYAVVCLFFGATCLIAGAAMTFPAVGKAGKVNDVKAIDEVDAKGIETPLRYPAWVGIFVSFLFTGMITSIYPYYAREALMISEPDIGTLMSVRALFNAAAFILLGYLTFWHFRAWQMVAAVIIMATLTMAMEYFPEVVPTGFFLAGAGVMAAMTYANSLFHGTSGSKNRTFRAAVHEVLLSLGSVGGAFLSGIIYEQYSMSGVYRFFAVCLLLGAAIQVLLIFAMRKSK